MNLSKLSVKRPVTTLMCVLVAVAFGLMSLMNLGLDLMPNMNIPVVLIMTNYEGASSEEIRNLVTVLIKMNSPTFSVYMTYFIFKIDVLANTATRRN